MHAGHTAVDFICIRRESAENRFPGGGEFVQDQVAAGPAVSVAVPTALVGYIAKQAFLWLTIPLVLYLVYVSQIPIIHDTLHSARHAAGFVKCH